VTEEGPSKAEAVIDVKASVDLWVIDEAFPAHSGPGLLKIGPHDDDQIIFELLGRLLEQPAYVPKPGHHHVKINSESGHVSVPYSLAASTSWMEQGPTITRILSSDPSRMFLADC